MKKYCNKKGEFGKNKKSGGKSESEPIDKNDSPAGKANNR